jgi:hypothetical protein
VRVVTLRRVRWWGHEEGFEEITNACKIFGKNLEGKYDFGDVGVDG